MNPRLPPQPLKGNPGGVQDISPGSSAARRATSPGKARCRQNCLPRHAGPYARNQKRAHTKPITPQIKNPNSPSFFRSRSVTRSHAILRKKDSNCFMNHPENPTRRSAPDTRVLCGRHLCSALSGRTVSPQRELRASTKSGQKRQIKAVRACCLDDT
jgi:hypothetical protein